MKHSAFYPKAEGPNETVVIDGRRWLSKLGKDEEAKQAVEKLAQVCLELSPQLAARAKETMTFCLTLS